MNLWPNLLQKLLFQFLITSCDIALREIFEKRSNDLFNSQTDVLDGTDIGRNLFYELFGLRLFQVVKRKKVLSIEDILCLLWDLDIIPIV